MCDSKRVPSELQVSTEIDGDRAVLRVTGDLDLATLDDLRTPAEAQLNAPDRSAVVIDLAGLTFLDSSGLGLLVGLRKQATRRQIGLVLAKVPSGPARIISIAGLSDTFGLAAQ
jgi:anti-sigma B factor antagonist